MGGPVSNPPTPPSTLSQKPMHVLGQELNLFQLSPINSSFTKKQWVSCNPSYKSGRSAVEFFLSGSGTQYTDLSKSYLLVKVKITRPGQTTPFPQDPNSHTALPIDNVLHSLWSDVQVKLNGTLVSTSNTNYCYKSYIENLLKFNTVAKDKQLSLVGFMGDNGYFDQIDPDEIPTSNALQSKLTLWTKIHTKYREGYTSEDVDDESEHWTDPTCVEFMGPLMADICQQDRLIMNGVNIDIKLIPQKDSFRLITFPKNSVAEIHIEDIKLMVCRVTLASETFLGIERTLQNIPVVYPFARTDIRTFNLNEGSYGETFENLYPGEVPSKLIVGMVKSEAFSGHFNLNPYRFRPFDVESIGFYVDDEATPRQPFSFDVRDCGYLEGLQSLYEVTGKWQKNTDLYIDRYIYRQGSFLVGFDVDGATSPNLTSYVGENKSGRTRLQVSFKKSLPCNVTVIVYAAFQEVAQIDATRNVSLREKDKMLKYNRS
jgi:hypothetical protein